MSKDLQILIPMGGFGKRLRPLTWSRPQAPGLPSREDGH